MALTVSGAMLSPAVTAATAAPTAPITTEKAAEKSPATSATAGEAWNETAYRGSVNIVEGDDETADTLDGVVFKDTNRNSQQDEDEPGIPGVTVSNGRDVVTTDEEGRYELPAFDNMTVFTTQPAGYQVPVDEDNVAQFYYNHLPEGSPELEYGGIEPTGPLPDAVNFPMVESELTAAEEQHCAIGADVQTYNEDEVEYARSGAFADLAARTDYAGCGALFIGDIVGDDLSLFPQTRELTSMLNGPARFLPGNHDIDFEALDGEHEFDTYRSQFGPEYHSYDVGQAHVVALSNIVYPKAPGETSGYTYGLGERQLEWLRQDIAAVPEDKAIVLAGHSPLLEFYYSDSHTHQDLQDIYDILEGREVISLGGHTHMSENLREGDFMAGWEDELGEAGLPFTHLTVPAVSGQWYDGRVQSEGYPTAIQRDGTPPGVLTLDIDGTEITERFTATGRDDDDQMALGLNTPEYREWFETYQDQRGEAPELENALAVTQDQLADTWLTTNFWMGSTGSTVEVAIDGGEPVEAERTQQMDGETPNIGAEFTDPVAVQEQFVHGGGLHDRTMHLWRLPLAEDLSAGEHTAEVTATDVHGREFTETLTFEVSEGSTEPEEPTAPEFSDNQPGSAFYAPVQWMAENGISVGYADGTFKKNQDVTRGETTAFLHRYVSPDFAAPATSPFSDVHADGAFYRPITWAADEKVTAGYADGSFKPSQAVTRGEFAAFLYRLAGPEHQAPAESPFDDLNAGGANYSAITWLSSEGITVGDTEGNFNQSEEITRAEISAFLQRYDRVADQD
ncbi:calcineurin-like phosphoesterase C-terminal domain-containing protein [Citricoccus sp. GCM10030269]